MQLIEFLRVLFHILVKMLSNKDIERLILSQLDSDGQTSTDKVLSQVAQQISGGEAEDRTTYFRLRRLWQKRNELAKHKQSDRYRKWQVELFEVHTSKGKRGRPAKRLSDDISRRTEINKLDNILANLEEMA